MKIKLVSIAMILTLTAGFNVNAIDLNGSNIDTERSGHKHSKRHGTKMKSRMGKIVHAYMLEQGDITQGEIDILKTEREANHVEMKALKEAGDTDGLAAKKEELKAKHEERRATMKEYINNNEALKTQLKEIKQKAKGKHSKHREKRREKITES